MVAILVDNLRQVWLVVFLASAAMYYFVSPSVYGLLLKKTIFLFKNKIRASICVCSFLENVCETILYFFTF